MPVVLTVSARAGGGIASDQVVCIATNTPAVERLQKMGNKSNQKTTGEHEWQHIETLSEQVQENYDKQKYSFMERLKQKKKINKNMRSK